MKINPTTTPDELVEIMESLEPLIFDYVGDILAIERLEITKVEDINEVAVACMKHFNGETDRYRAGTQSVVDGIMETIEVDGSEDPMELTIAVASLFQSVMFEGCKQAVREVLIPEVA